jgi:methyltransferase (TIGR00027 family)
VKRKTISHTAIKVARGTVALSRIPEVAALLPADAATSTETLLSEMGLLKPWMDRVFRSSWYARKARDTGGTYIGLRKRFFDDETRRAIEDGAEQVLVLGAGLDTLGMRLSNKFPEVLFVEVDVPVTMEPKIRALEALGETRPNHVTLPKDLATTALEDAVAAVPEWDSQARTLVVAEGLLMYLPETAVVTLLSTLRQIAGPGSRFVFSYLTLDERGRVHTLRRPGLARIFLKLMGEEWLWGVRPADLHDFLDANGWALESDESRLLPAERYCDLIGEDPPPISDLEYWAVASIPPG